MSVVTGGGGRGEVTLAFSLSAVERLADPAAAFADAGEWSRYVGVVDDDREAVAAVVDEHALRQDFEVGDRDKWLALEEVGLATDTPRHVYVGAGVEDRRVATHLGWEFRHVTDAAEKAGWELADPTGESGALDRLLGWLR